MKTALNQLKLFCTVSVLLVGLVKSQDSIVCHGYGKTMGVEDGKAKNDISRVLEYDVGGFDA
eukprot:CAMPEP_0116888726 /NCGR_PEP_ID=MMETSP0463-20121206/23906_1 /TAXON_ID=181622 /ORGANISM="Strombidinopsis sp, Strain SopsisLIS2011" /LENGTH=61 /DNA_ID=CAMNT_0004554095 /DNA_START=12 /DNA_END=197 /DNA_ORIENTATION=+